MQAGLMLLSIPIWLVAGIFIVATLFACLIFLALNKLFNLKSH